MRITNNNFAIKLINVSKKYEIHHEKPTLVEKFIKGKTETFWALKDINLEINKGEKVGIIGPNGSGKTTLLKIISKITNPTGGNVHINGKVVSLIDLEAGFNPDLTGYQNIFINGLLLGINRKDIQKILSDIISFAGIKQFIDTPVYTYSQGMKLRLGFSIAIHSNPDILILDEAVTAGDAEFIHKSYLKMKKFSKEGKTIVIVSHWIDFVKKNCDRMLYMKNGQISDQH